MKATLCPVCHKPITFDVNGNIDAHSDGTNVRACPMSGSRYARNLLAAVALS